MKLPWVGEWKKGNPETIPWRARDEHFSEQEFMEKVAEQSRRRCCLLQQAMGETGQTNSTDSPWEHKAKVQKIPNHHSQNEPFQWEQGWMHWKFMFVWDMHLPEGKSYWEEWPQCSSSAELPHDRDISCPHFLPTNTDQAHTQIHLAPLIPAEKPINPFQSLQKCF